MSKLSDFSGKWELKDRTGEGEKFLLLLGRNSVEAKLAGWCTEIQHLTHFLVGSLHVLEKTAHLEAGVKNITYGTVSRLDGKPCTYVNDEKGFGDGAVCVSKIKEKDNNAYVDLWRIKRPLDGAECTLTSKRTLIEQGKKTRVDLKITCKGETAECCKIYVKIPETPQEIQKKKEQFGSKWKHRYSTNN